MLVVDVAVDGVGSRVFNNLISSADPSAPLGGSLGCGVLCEFALSVMDAP